MNIVRERLSNTLLTSSHIGTPEQVVEALGAVQAQDYPGAKWALSLRANDASDAEIEQAFSDGRILRTHVLRPTWHFVAPQDIRWMLALTAPRISASMASYNRKLELTPRLLSRCNRLIAKELEGEKFRTRAELRAVLERSRVVVGTAQRLSHMMLQAELDAVVCSGPRRGGQFTYALLDERAPTARPMERDDALERLTTRYFTTRGPATVHDFAWWSGLTMADAKRGIDICVTKLELMDIAGRSYWAAPRGSRAPTESGKVFLLPNYDEYFIGYRDRSAIGERVKSVHLVTGGDSRTAHVVIVDGQIAGGWRLTGNRDATVLRLNLLAPLTATERKRLAAQVERFSRFVGAKVQVANGPSRSRG